MRLRPALLFAITNTLWLGGCLRGTDPIVGTPIDCATLATSLDQSAVKSTLTTLPDSLKLRDVTVGTGATVANGQLLSVHYSGCLVPSGTKFDENTNDVPTFDFQVGASGVIVGFNEGVVNMKVGGRRQLVIPPALAYGAAGLGSIPGNATLVFTIDAVATR